MSPAEQRQRFADRLAQAFAYNGTRDRDEQLRQLVSAGGVTRRTAQRWLSGKASPGRWMEPYVRLAIALGVSTFWLYGKDDAPGIRKWRLLEYREALPEFQQRQLEGMLRRARQRPQLCAPIDCAVRGEITFFELVRLAS